MTSLISPDLRQARIAEEAGAVAVMALERIPADIKRDGGVARSSDPQMIKDVMSSTSLPGEPPGSVSAPALAAAHHMGRHALRGALTPCVLSADSDGQVAHRPLLRVEDP